MIYLLSTPLAFLISIVTVLINGFCFSLLWKWFVVETFKIPEIAVVQAAGLYLLGAFINITTQPYDYAKTGLRDLIIF